jgi:transcriptional regulator with XRE-family HTH domain
MIISKTTEKTLKSIEKEITRTPLTLGKLILSIRNADGIPQTLFAQTLGISKQHLCDIEHDRKTISPRMAAHYANLLGYSEEQFIRLSLQAIVDRDGLKVEIDIKSRFGIQNISFA